MMNFTPPAKMIVRVPRGYQRSPNQGKSKQNLMSSRDNVSLVLELHSQLNIWLGSKINVKMPQMYHRK
jgi:hypothetical protein